jgi:hydroxyacyl-ACP dehydratase HTD2-like protein with hotdog domain
MSKAATRFDALNVGELLPTRDFECGNVQLMLYNAALWNGHRIHFDEPYATQVEEYPGLVVAGPLLGDWLHQCVEEWLGDDGRVVSIDYSNRVATYVGDLLISGGTVSECRVDSKEAVLDVFIKNAADEVVTPGQVLVRFGDVW